MSTALITGASSGMGRDMAFELAARGYDLILVARRADRLEALAQKLPVKTKCISADLSDPASCYSLFEAVADEPVTLLINNAGFGAFGACDTIPLERELEMIHLNVTAVHILTKLFLKRFLEQNQGGILNVASAAGFMPGGPLLSAYYATKAYVLSLSRGIQKELRHRKSPVWISTLCPGPVKTEFEAVAGVDFRSTGIESKTAAKIAIQKFLKKKAVIIPGTLMKFGYLGAKLLPANFLLSFAHHYQTERQTKR